MITKQCIPVDVIPVYLLVKKFFTHKQNFYRWEVKLPEMIKQKLPRFTEFTNNMGKMYVYILKM